MLTLDELERWLTDYIVCVCHAKRHRGIGTSPLHRWTVGIFGDERSPGRGAIDRPSDEEQIRLDFLPFVERTVQPNGVVIEGIQYYSDVLRRFMGATLRTQKRQLLFRRDPRDISVVHFWDPDVRRYSAVPYRNIARPPISVWELRELLRELHEIGTAQIDEPAAYERLRDREARAVSETKRVRRARERRPAGANEVSPDETMVDTAVQTINLAQVKPFEVEDEP